MCHIVHQHDSLYRTRAVSGGQGMCQGVGQRGGSKGRVKGCVKGQAKGWVKGGSRDDEVRACCVCMHAPALTMAPL